MASFNIENIIIETNNCYCCFNETENRSPCKCKAYICKKCLKKYSRFETKCKICNTKLEKASKKCKCKCKYHYNLRCNINSETICNCILEYIIFNPLFIIIIGAFLIIGIIILPSLIFSILTSILANKEFIFIFNFGTWITGLFILVLLILIILLLFCIITAIIESFYQVYLITTNLISYNE